MYIVVITADEPSPVCFHYWRFFLLRAFGNCQRLWCTLVSSLKPSFGKKFIRIKAKKTTSKRLFFQLKLTLQKQMDILIKITSLSRLHIKRNPLFFYYFNVLIFIKLFQVHDMVNTDLFIFYFNCKINEKIIFLCKKKKKINCIRDGHFSKNFASFKPVILNFDTLTAEILKMQESSTSFHNLRRYVFAFWKNSSSWSSSSWDIASHLFSKKITSSGLKQTILSIEPRILERIGRS